MRSAAAPILLEEGVIGAVAINVDITEQKRMARELSAQREWFRVTLASIGDAVIASNPDGLVTYLNEAAETLTGWRAHEATGRPLANIFNIVNEKTRKRVENPADVVLRTGRVVGLANHTVLIDANGIERPIADSAAPIRDADGHVIGVVLVFRRDVLERQNPGLLTQPLERTLPGAGSSIQPGQMRQDVARRVDQLTRPHLYYGIYQLIGGRDALLQLQPFPKG